MDLLAQSSKVLPQSSPKHDQVVTGIPQYWYQFVLVGVSIPAQTSWRRSKLGRKGFIHLTFPHCCSSLKEVRTGTQAGQGAGTDAEAMEGCSLLACLLSLLSYRTKTTSPEMVPPTRDLSPLITNEKVPYSWISWRHFLNWSSFLCDNSSYVKLIQN